MGIDIFLPTPLEQHISDPPYSLQPSNSRSEDKWQMQEYIKLGHIALSSNPVSGKVIPLWGILRDPGKGWQRFLRMLGYYTT